MTKFKELFEATTERAIFEHKGTINFDKMYDLVEHEDQTFITVSDIQEYASDSSGYWMLHFLGEGPNTKAWEKFAKFIESKCKNCNFERLVP